MGAQAHESDEVSVSPNDLKFSPRHVWARAEGAMCRVGITAHAQEQTGEILYVDLPEIGLEVAADAPFMEIESSKVIAEVHSPVSGVVSGVNRALEDNPKLVNQNPHGDGWLVEVSLKDSGDLQGLMNHADYQAMLGQEA